MFIDEEDEDQSFVERHPGLIFLAIILIVVPGIYFVARKLSGTHAARAKQDEVMIQLPPPPPSPRPKPTPTPEQTPPPEDRQRMIDQVPTKDITKAPPKPAAPAPLGTSITGPGGGPDMGLGTGLGGGGGFGGEGMGGDKYGWYASEVQTRVADAVRKNPLTRTASMNIKVRIWPDSTGRIVKAHISGSTGDPALDAALQNDVLTGLQLPEAPPSDMPLPIVMWVSAQRPQ